VEAWPTVFVIDQQGVVRYKGALMFDDGTEKTTLAETARAGCFSWRRRTFPGFV
jgi:hypothetical protein